MAIWISSNIDIGRSLNSRDSFARPGPILSPSTISFDLHAKTAEEIDLEKCNFRNLGSSVTLTWDRVEVTLVRISGWGLSTHQIRSKSEKLLWTYSKPEFQSTTSLPSNDLKIIHFTLWKVRRMIFVYVWSIMQIVFRQSTSVTMILTLQPTKTVISWLLRTNRYSNIIKLSDRITKDQDTVFIHVVTLCAKSCSLSWQRTLT